MSAHIKGSRFTEFIDPAVVADTFCEGIGEIEKISDDCVRLTFFASRSIGEGERERIVVARLVAPISVFARSIRQCEAFADGTPQMSDEGPRGDTAH